MQYTSDLHPKLALRPHHVWKYGRHPLCDSVIAEIRRGKKKDRKKKPQGKNIMACPIT